MKIVSFRICGFRSILDTGWRNLSPDNVTVLVGQNESGKSSILEALATTFGKVSVTEDDIRTDGTTPSVELKLEIEKQDIEVIKNDLEEEGFHTAQIEVALKFFEGLKEPLHVSFDWERANVEEDGTNKTEFEGRIIYENLILADQLSAAVPKETEHDDDAAAASSQPSTGEQKPATNIETATKNSELTVTKLTNTLDLVTPMFIYFDHSRGQLPSQIDIVKTKFGYRLEGEGSSAANNFLRVAGLKLKDLVEGSERQASSLLKKANNEVTKDFASFWSQTIGRSEKLQLECELRAYPAGTPEKAGHQYLVFWINDGSETKLYPKQRSLGVRWFTAFYLQFKATEKRRSDYKRLFLLDEPGSNLHSKAQSDVLRLINQLSKDIAVVYSTHTPHLVEYDKLYRVLAVQRIGEDVNNPTEVIPALELGTASSDTLSPVLNAMGVDLSSQEVIRKRNNVLIEEPSGFYYLTAFWEVTDQKQDAHFIAATGVNKIPALANMFLGWGLEYVVVTDDDSAGRRVYNELKKNLFADDEELASQKMLKIKCNSKN